MHKRLWVVLVVGLFVSLYVYGCVTANVKPMSPTGYATVMLNTYYTQAKQTEAMSKRANLTEAQKDIVRKRKAIIKQVDPLIKAYGRVIAGGGVPTPDQEQAIASLIDDLVALSTQ